MFSNMKVGSRLAIAFGVVVVLLAAVLVTGISRMAVTKPGAAFAYSAASLVPAVMPLLAAVTRIPQGSLLHLAPGHTNSGPTDSSRITAASG